MDFILSIIIVFPLLGTLFGLLVDEKSIKTYGISIAFIEFALVIAMWAKFGATKDILKFVEFVPFIPELGINYFLGVDGISLFLVIMSAFLFLVAMICLNVKDHQKHFVLAILLLEMSIMGVFVSLDALLFVVFWEQSLLPMFYIIGIFGGQKRVFATMKFFIYTFFGSVFMLVGVVAVAYYYYEIYGVISFNMIDWMSLRLPLNIQIWLFLAFSFPFIVKTPLFPFHTWLPIAYTQAPFLGSVFLSAMMSKMGVYGFLRFSLPMFPDASAYLSELVCILAVITVVYASFIAYHKNSAKEIISYSSMAHMGVIVLGIFSMNIIGVGGAVFLMISHALVSAGLFILIGYLQNRTNDDDITHFGGLAKDMPFFAFCFAVLVLGLIGLPLTSGFVGEFLSLLGIFHANPYFAVFGGLGIIMSVVYSLRLFTRIFFGTNGQIHAPSDIKSGEIFAILPIVLIVVFLGVMPKFMLNDINTSVGNFITEIYNKSNKTTKIYMEKSNLRTINE